MSAVVVAQLVDRSLLILEIHGSNPVIGKFLKKSLNCILSLACFVCHCAALLFNLNTISLSLSLSLFLILYLQFLLAKHFYHLLPCCKEFSCVWPIFFTSSVYLFTRILQSVFLSSLYYSRFVNIYNFTVSLQVPTY